MVGSVYVFVKQQDIWIQEAKLTASDSVILGTSVAIEGDNIVVGDPGAENENGMRIGAAYVFRRNASAWERQSKLAPIDPRSSVEMGYSVAISGDTIFVGAPEDDDRGTNAGSVDVFQWDGSDWTGVSKLRPSDIQLSDYFGSSVALYEDAAVVGTWNWSSQGHGEAYLYQRIGDTWTEQTPLPVTGGSGVRSVAIDGNYSVVGAPLGDELAYVYELP